MQAKDVPAEPILDAMRAAYPSWSSLAALMRAMPAQTPRKVAIAKLDNLRRQGLVTERDGLWALVAYEPVTLPRWVLPARRGNLWLPSDGPPVDLLGL